MLTSDIDDLLGAFPGRAGIVVKDLSTGACFEHGADDRFPAASVIKVPIMVELYRQVEAGRISLGQQCGLHDGVCRHGTGHIKENPDRVYTLEQLCRYMIADSDDVATDLITETIGLEQVNQTLADLGFGNTSVPMSMGRWHYTMLGMGDATINPENDDILEQRVREVRIDFDTLSYADSLDNNVTSAGDMARMLEQIHAGELVSAAAAAAMLQMLHACDHRGMIPRDLPEDIPIAHKIGQSTRIRADVGIVYLPGGPIVICVLTCAPEPGTSRPGKNLIAGIAQRAVNTIKNGSPIA